MQIFWEIENHYFHSCITPPTRFLSKDIKKHWKQSVDQFYMKSLNFIYKQGFFLFFLLYLKWEWKIDIKTKQYKTKISLFNFHKSFQFQYTLLGNFVAIWYFRNLIFEKSNLYTHSENTPYHFSVLYIRKSVVDCSAYITTDNCTV